MFFKYLILILLPISFHSQNIVGNYYPIETKCKLFLKIGSQNNFALYSNNKLKSKGIVKISKEEDTIYLDFGIVSSMYDNDTIYIQNSGNSMNPYWNFKECDEKFIHLIKNNDAKIIDFEKEYDLLSKNANCNFSYSIDDLKALSLSNPITLANVNKYNNFAYYLQKQEKECLRQYIFFKKSFKNSPPEPLPTSTWQTAIGQSATRT